MLRFTLKDNSKNAETTTTKLVSIFWSCVDLTQVVATSGAAQWLSDSLQSRRSAVQISKRERENVCVICPFLRRDIDPWNGLDHQPRVSYTVVDGCFDPKICLTQILEGNK